ncbi:hypothetical protein UNDYM_3965 [Undibacterium sp. YM2]|nr:hypothetical protein UNDYM_3965 [Undibacterium sp. YM2]
MNGLSGIRQGRLRMLASSIERWIKQGCAGFHQIVLSLQMHNAAPVYGPD